MQEGKVVVWEGFQTDSWGKKRSEKQWWYHSNAESEEESKSLLIRVKEESEKAGLKLSIQKTNIMASALWLIDGGKMQTVTDFLFLGSKITVDGDWSHEIKRLLLGRKAMTNLNSILKNRDITLLTKVHIVKAMVFPLVMYGCESWIIKKLNESWIIKKLNAKELMILNCDAWTPQLNWESFGQQGDQTNQP